MLHRPSAVSGSYALGWFVEKTASGAPMITHSGDLFTSTAYQAMLPASGYGVAVMANTGLSHGHASALAERLVALIEGTPPPPAGMSLVVVDAVLLLLAVATAGLAGRGVLRSRHWAAGRAVRAWTLLRLLPLLAPPLLLTSIHRVVGWLYRGRDVAWIQVAYIYPTFMVLLVTATLGCATVLVARLVRLGRG